MATTEPKTGEQTAPAAGALMEPCQPRGPRKAPRDRQMGAVPARCLTTDPNAAYNRAWPAVPIFTLGRHTMPLALLAGSQLTAQDKGKDKAAKDKATVGLGREVARR